MSDSTDLTDEEAFHYIESLADATQVALVVGDEDAVEKTLEEIKSIASDHYDESEVRDIFADYDQ
jgi:hypothetical protein